jgi:hypothetical protein
MCQSYILPQFNKNEEPVWTHNEQFIYSQLQQCACVSFLKRTGISNIKIQYKKWRTIY